MKRDLKINYGILDDIIDELRTYEKALQTMEKSLVDIAVLVRRNEGKSIDAWGRNLNTSKNEINRYQVQVSDLLSLFENYVADTTAYISPLARQTMMRVDRNDIWGNLQQISTGLNNGVTNALITGYSQPNSFLFGLLEDPSDAEKEASEYNKKQLESIQENIKSTQSVLEEKMEDLKESYEKKVIPFENTDDDYKGLVADVKKKYTSFFEGIKETLGTIGRNSVDIVRGVWNGLVGMVTGIVTIAGDVGIVAVSGIIPDKIEPKFLKEKADETFDGYKEAALQLIQDPISVVELVAQSVSDTVEEEGIAYVGGQALTALIPASGAVKLAKGASKLKGAGKLKGSISVYSKKNIQGKIDAAKAGLADVKVPTFTQVKLSTGTADIPAFKVEMKPLSETHPQMFAVKGDGKADKSTKDNPLLPTEGKVATFKELAKQGTAFDNITPHHMPSAAKMKEAGVKRNNGVSMNMEQPHPGVGGRHRETYTYGLNGKRLEEYLNLSYREALAYDILDAKMIYMKNGIYTPEIREGLLNTIRKNRELYPELFNK